MAKAKSKKPASPASPATAAAPQDDLAHIAPGLRALAVRVDSLSPDPRNARRRTDKNLMAVKGSLRAFGQQKPIVIDSQNVVRAGNATFQAAGELGWTWIAASVSDLSGSELIAFAIADNRSAELAQWNDEVLGPQLEALRDEDLSFSLEDVGFDEKDLARILPEAPPETGSGAGSGAGSDAQYRIIIECRDEMQQSELLARFDAEGLSCKALVA